MPHSENANRDKAAAPTPKPSKPPLLSVGQELEQGVFEIIRKGSTEVLYHANRNHDDDDKFDVVPVEENGDMQQFKAGKIGTGKPCGHCLKGRKLCGRVAACIDN